jgi:hypothetical protein
MPATGIVNGGVIHVIALSGAKVELAPQNRHVHVGRDGFYIHGAGPHGSDGCIVPTDTGQIPGFGVM